MFLFLEASLKFQIEQGDLFMLMLNEVNNLKGRSNMLKNIDSVPSNVQSSRQEALLYVFKDNESSDQDDH